MHCRIWCSALLVKAVVVRSWDASCVHCEGAHSLHHSSTQPQPSLTVQNTICGSAHSCSPNDGHNDARNMLRQKFDNKHQISCILFVSLSSPYVHYARSQEPKIMPVVSQKFFSSRSHISGDI